MTDAAMAAPTRRVDMWFAGTAPQRRMTVAFRIILAIPQFIVLYFLYIAMFFVLVIGWFGALFMGRLPEWVFSFVSGVVRWTTRVYAYMYLLTDRYPPFSLDDEDYPARPIIPAPGRLNRWAVLFRIVLVIPAAVFCQIVQYGLTFPLIFVAWLIVALQRPDAPGALRRVLGSVALPGAPALLFHDADLGVRVGNAGRSPRSAIGVPATATAAALPALAWQHRHHRPHRHAALDGRAHATTGAAVRLSADAERVDGRRRARTGRAGDRAGYRAGRSRPAGYLGARRRAGHAGVAPAHAASAPAPAGLGTMPPPSPWERSVPSGPAADETPPWATLVLTGAARGWVIFAIVWGSIVLVGQSVAQSVAQSHQHTSAEQVNTVVRDYNRSDTAIETASTEYTSCATVACLRASHLHAATRLTQFADDLRNMTLPANAGQPARVVESDTAQLSSILSRLANSSDLSSYRATISRSNLTTILSSYHVDTEALVNALNSDLG